jgi:hypothetical protein
MNPPTVGRTSTTAFWWAVYIFVGIAFVGILLYWPFHSRQPWQRSYDSWIQAGILTAVVFGYLLKWGWKYRRKGKFWIIYLGLLALHCGVCAVTAARVVRFSIPLLAISGSVEVMAMAFFIALMAGELSR